MVSWKLAAEMNESVESDAFVIPEQHRLALRRTSARFQHLVVLGAELELVHDLFGQEFGIADVLHLHPAHHLAARWFPGACR